MTGRMIGDRGEPGYEYPQRIATPEGLRAERRKIRRSMGSATTSGDKRALRQLGARLARLDAVARWRGWPASGSHGDDEY